MASSLSDSKAIAAEQQAQSEIDEYLATEQQRRRLVPRAALAGAAAGVLAVLFRTALQGMDALRNALVTWAHQFPIGGWVFPVAFGAVTATGAVYLVRRYAPETSGSGIPHLKAVLHKLRELRPVRILIIKFFGGLLALGSGMAVGREGPTVQMGGAASDLVARRVQATSPERMTLIAAGAGAGLAAAFNAPLAGFIFVLEEVQRDFRASTFAAAFIAAAVADVITRLAAGQAPVFVVPNYPSQSLATLPVFIVMGLVCGVFGVLYNKLLLRTLDAYARLKGRALFAVVAVVGAVAGMAAWVNPNFAGGGHALTEQVIAGDIVMGAIPILLLFRLLFMLASYGTGAPGGIFAPLLVLGALVGLGIGRLGQWLAPSVVTQPEVFAVVGMAALFTAIVRAPLTGIILIVEMTGSYTQMLPLLATCFCAYVVAEHLNDMPIYEALLKRDLEKNGLPDVTEPMVLEFEIAPHAPFSGKLVRELGLPAGCILVKVREGGREWIPLASTRLQAHQRITAVISPEAERGLEALREGCNGE
jgi:CIC family chloride channel protein